MLALFWLFSLSMVASGTDRDPNSAWVLISSIRWVLTAITAVTLLIWGTPKYIKHCAEEAKKREAELKRYYNTEIEKRFKSLREKELCRLDNERNTLLGEIKMSEMNRRAQLENQWREEFENKIEAELRERTHSEVSSQTAINEFT
jgi:hypothetical protein